MVMNRIGQQCNVEKLSALLTDEIAEPDSQALLAHLEQCATCRQELADLSRTMRELHPKIRTLSRFSGEVRLFHGLLMTIFAAN